MRLINTKSLTLIEVWDSATPEYAILSHRWTDEEVTLDEFSKGASSHDDSNTRQKAGWKKISSAADQANQDGFSYLWVDTCCIDKTSSAELTEAINSMYRWYRDSAVCYVHLNDVDYDNALVPVEEGDGTDAKTPFERSQWHTRGWTLQELLAPRDIRFYSREWKRLDKDGAKPIEDYVSLATGVDVDILRGKTPVQATSVARRMSWASRRQTSRTEDMAYCLLGLFDVNMPMLYGEGDKAFRRLQEEIMKTSKDQSLFAWTHVETDPVQGGLLAPHPRNFAYSAGFEDKSELQDFSNTSEHVAAREGIVINLNLVEVPHAEMVTRKGDGMSLHQYPPEASITFYNATLKCTENNDPNRFVHLSLVDWDHRVFRIKNTVQCCGRIMGEAQDVLIWHNVPFKPIEQLRQDYVRIVLETNCSKAYAIALPSKLSPPPEFRSKKARADATAAFEASVEVEEDVARVTEGRREPNTFRTGDIPIRHTETEGERREKFSSGTFEQAFNVPLGDLKWIVPLLPNTCIAYLRVVTGTKTRGPPGRRHHDHSTEPRGMNIGTDSYGVIGFNAGHRRQGGGYLEGYTHEPIEWGKERTLLIRRKNYDRPTAGGEVAEIKIGLIHLLPSDSPRPKFDEHTAVGPDLGKCPCTLEEEAWEPEQKAIEGKKAETEAEAKRKSREKKKKG